MNELVGLSHRQVLQRRAEAAPRNAAPVRVAKPAAKRRKSRVSAAFARDPTRRRESPARRRGAADRGSHRGPLRAFFYCGPADAPTGLVGLELFGDVALLRSLVVVPAARSSGMGTALVRYAENYARSQGVRTLYLLTTTAEGFFARLGYSHAARDAAPPAIRSTREFAGLCPASSAFMSKQL